MKRREFLAMAGAAAAAAAMTGGKVSATPLGSPFGYQAWELAPDMMKDWDGRARDAVGAQSGFVL